jgi:hypothetical protein
MEKKKRATQVPRTYAEALAQGFCVCEENFTGDLGRKGKLTLDRIDKATGDCERLTVPFTAKYTVGRPTGYRVERHAYEVSAKQKVIQIEEVRRG